MKNKILFFCILALVLASTSIIVIKTLYKPKDIVKTTTTEWLPSEESITQASIAFSGDLDALQNEASLIVIVEPLNEFAKETPTITDDYYYTNRTVLVKKIIKGEVLDKNIKVREFAAISENEDTGEKLLNRFEDYYPMEKGKKYMLFLGKGSEDNYGIYGVYQGKFNIDGLDMRQKDLEKIDFYRKSLNDIKVKFKKEIKEVLKEIN